MTPEALYLRAAMEAIHGPGWTVTAPEAWSLRAERGGAWVVYTHRFNGGAPMYFAEERHPHDLEVPAPFRRAHRSQETP